MTKAESKIGRIYKKWNTRGDGSRVEHATWTVRYQGKDYATGETDVKRAKNRLLKIVGDIAHGDRPGALVPKQEPGPAAPIVAMNAVFDAVIANSRRKGNATTAQNEGQIDLHMRPFFGLMDAARLTSADFETYTDLRMDQDAAPATINRELATIKRALNLAVQRDPPLILRRPHIEMLPVSNVRKGFLTHGGYITLRIGLPDYLAPLLVAGYHVGCRKAELTQVELPEVEMDAIPQPQFRLYPDATKTGEGRVVPIFGDMVEVFREQIAMTRREYPGCTWLFHNKGEQIQSFYKAWNTATKAVHLEWLLFHDLRRTAVRNLIRSGVDRKVAMGITGHKTEEVFERYNITNEEDLQGAATKMDTYMALLNARLTPMSELIS